MHLLSAVKQSSLLLLKGKEAFHNVLPAGKMLRGSIFYLALSVIGLLMQLQKEQEFLQLRGTRSFTTSNSHPNQHTAY